MDTPVQLIKMGESSANALNLSESALNLLKKSELVQKILDLKGKVFVDADLHKLSDQNQNLQRLLIKFNWKTKKLDVNWLLPRM